MCKRKSNSRPVAGDRVSGMRCDIKKLGPDQLLDLVLAADILRTLQICSNRNKFLEGSFSMLTVTMDSNTVRFIMLMHAYVSFEKIHLLSCGYTMSVHK